ncbi:MAG: hypothetical protein CV087_22735 [Candidatus Brocadia sp. WS118]|nr:MAG: hypothetical protein CV087_22735 [Candidatus Brocadia sp. WS118]
MENVFVDYREQRVAFDELCKPSCTNPILFFEGESGSGKTALLLDCMNRIPKTIEYIAFNCKSGTISISEIFSRSVHKLGWAGLSEFRESVLSLSKGLTINIQDIKQKGDQNTINIALRAESEEERESRQTMLTDAWFRDVRNLNNQLLVIVDTFEKSNSETSNWICGPFLARIPNTPLMRVLIAGQKTPDMKNIEWGNYCRHHRLLGVLDAQEWMPVVEAKGRYINVDNPMTWLAGVCHALEGRPEAIMKVIEGLPRSIGN